MDAKLTYKEFSRKYCARLEDYMTEDAIRDIDGMYVIDMKDEITKLIRCEYERYLLVDNWVA